MTTCTHFWQLPIGGPTVVGVCKLCRAEREFQTSHENQLRAGAPGHPSRNQAGTPVRGYEPSMQVKP